MQLTIVRTYTCVGVLFGLGFPAAGLMLDAFVLRQAPLSVPELMRTNPIHFIVALAPSVLGAVFHVIGRIQSRLRERAVADERARTFDTLEQALERAQAGERSKAEFLANMSHEIRTPMNAVLGMADLLREAGLPPEPHSYAEIIATSGRELLRIIDDVLDLSKVDAGHLEILHEPFDPAALALAVGALVAPGVAAKGVEVVVDVDPGLPARVYGDEGRLRQVLLNLVGNAVKFTDHGTVRILLDLKAIDDCHVTIAIAVKDTGLGIPQGSLGRIFDAFGQADSAANRRHGGTGLGLTIAARLTGLMGGRIGIETREGVGSVFSLDLTFEIAPAAVPGTIRSRAKGCRLLIVEQNAEARIALARTAAALGIKAETQATCAEGLAAALCATAAGRPFDVVILDRPCEEPNPWGAARVVLAALPGPVPSAAKAGTPVLSKPVGRPALAALFSAPFQGIQPPLCSGGAAIADAPDTSDNLPLDILVAEDNLTNQAVIRAMLRGQSLNLTVVHDGAEAVSHAEAQRFDLILMDVSMPGMDGLEATRHIRQTERRNGTRPVQIVALTANAFPSDRARCLAAGMDGFLSKPVNKTDLLRVVGQMRATGDSAAPGPPRPS